MPTVPNWIPRAVVILPHAGYRQSRVVPIKDWRATATQVVVTLDTPSRSERRFYLDGLSPVGATHKRTELVDPQDPQESARIRHLRAVEAIKELDTEIALNRLSSLSDDELEKAIRSIRDAADAALQRIAEVR